MAMTRLLFGRLERLADPGVGLAAPQARGAKATLHNIAFKQIHQQCREAGDDRYALALRQNDGTQIGLPPCICIRV